MAVCLLDCYICDYCDRTFSRKYNLRIHIENCHLNESCFCHICEETFGSPGGLLLHLSRGHNRFQQGFPECDICGRIFKRKQNIVSHMETVHLQNVKYVRCQVCRKPFTTARNLKRHIIQIHNAKTISCDVCFLKFKSKSFLAAHIQSVHMNNDVSYADSYHLKRPTESEWIYKCKMCPKVYTTNRSLRRHLRMRQCTKDATIEPESSENYTYTEDNKDHDMSNECETCKETFDEETKLRQHIKSTHSFKIFYDYCRSSLLKQAEFTQGVTDDKTFYSCPICQITFKFDCELKRHMRLNHDRDCSVFTCNVCYNKFNSSQSVQEHRQICKPPPNVNACNQCDKLFTDVSSLEFHIRIFHPQPLIAVSDVTSTNQDENVANDDTNAVYRCDHCERVYYSERSLKHHMKLKHTTDKEVECKLCNKICNNKYYLASHMKIVHTNNAWSKCEFCEKQFKSNRNIRRHIENTHLGMQRYKCIECETLFKEKRSLRKHVRTKHPNSARFPQCHICHKRFESAKSCKIHLKLLHCFNVNTHPCHLCSVSFASYEALKSHLKTNHLAEDEIYKCEKCNIVFKGHEKFEQHNELCHIELVTTLVTKQKLMPRCIICMKDFSTRKTLKRHIKKFHVEFEPDELATYGSKKRNFQIDCDNCIKNFNEDFYVTIYQKLKHLRDSVVFRCEVCDTTYNVLEYFIQRYKLRHADTLNSKMILSDLCTAEMSDDDDEEFDDGIGDFGLFHEEMMMEPESTTNDFIKQEPMDDLVLECDVKIEPESP